ncbi:MAG: hypothetical protein AABP62_27770 [Planctomycetota bacterium]
MLLVTFHGGSPSTSSASPSPPPPINNVVVYATHESRAGQLLSSAALEPPKSDPAALSELRGMKWDGKQLYVVNGSKKLSNVLVYQHAGGPSFVKPQVMIAASFTKSGHFTTSIAHPFGLAFRDADTCFVSNQDTNVVALVDLSGKPAKDGSLGKVHHGSQSKYLNGKYDQKKFLAGTFVASEVGNLHGIKFKESKGDKDDSLIQDVSKADGGLGVKPAPTTSDPNPKPAHSVRDVLIVGDVLYVCNEAKGTLNFYAVADGTYLGRTASKSIASPTHFAVQNGGIWISAGKNLFWMQSLSAAKPVVSAPTVSAISLGSSNPNGWKLGGLSFKTSGGKTTAYIPLQSGTGGNNSGGSIITAPVTPGKSGNPPTLGTSSVFVANLTDTPEFVLYVQDKKGS